jgi:hypothetical protein
MKKIFSNVERLLVLILIFILLALLVFVALKINNNRQSQQAPRIMMWFGKVNQHWNLEKNIWETDADGESGADINKLDYCRKFYPSTAKVVIYKNETSDNWQSQGKYTSTKMSYRCVLKGQKVEGDDVSNYKDSPEETPLEPEFSPKIQPIMEPGAEPGKVPMEPKLIVY